MDETNIVKETLKEELQRNERAQQVYEREIASLPRGSITVRERHGKPYCYLKYRDGDKTVTAYVGAEEKVGEELKKQVQQRKTLQDTLKRLKKEHAFIVKTLKG